MGRAPCCDKVGLKRGRWTVEEDEILSKYIQANGEGSWRSLPKNAGLLRCGKSCRLRWINYLRADIKRGNFSSEEEDTIVKMHSSYGNRWSMIASHLPGRTDNEIKNYWNSHLSRKIYSFSKETEPRIVDIPPPKRKRGRTSRWAMKKNKSSKQITTIEHEVSIPSRTPSLDTENDTKKLIDDVEVKRTHEEEEETTSYELMCDDILGLSELLDGINEDSEVLRLGHDDMMTMENSKNCLLEACGSVLNLSEERENSNSNCVVVGVGVGVGVGVDDENEITTNNDGVMCLNKIVSREDTLESGSVNQSGEWSSMNLDLDDKWDWESVMEFDFDNNSSSSSSGTNRGHEENLLNWLCEDDDWESDDMLGEIDPQKQNDLIAWFLS